MMKAKTLMEGKTPLAPNRYRYIILAVAHTMRGLPPGSRYTSPVVRV